jgi:hypothetical protein
MTVTMELKPEIEARLREQAAAQGVSIEVYIQRVLESITAEPKPISPEDRSRRFEEWMKGHSYIKVPPLSDEAISRENIYGDREERQL